MSTNQGVAYVLRGEDDDGWLRPAPVREVVRDAVVAATDLDADSLPPLDDAVDVTALRAVVGGDRSDPLTFTVEGHDVTVTPDGDVRVDDA